MKVIGIIIVEFEQLRLLTFVEKRSTPHDYSNPTS